MLEQQIRRNERIVNHQRQAIVNSQSWSRAPRVLAFIFVGTETTTKLKSKNLKRGKIDFHAVALQRKQSMLVWLSFISTSSQIHVIFVLQRRRRIE